MQILPLLDSIDPRFLPHNSHLDSPQNFQERDPQLRRLKAQLFVHHSSLINKFPITEPGIYTLGGGRQIGKTTLLKQWMAQLISLGTSSEAILFFSGELIDDHHAFLHLLQYHLSLMPKGMLPVTY